MSSREIKFRGKRIDNGEWVGRVIGNITVLNHNGYDINGNAKFSCKCSCGKVYDILIRNLKNSKGVFDRCCKCFLRLRLGWR